MASVQSDPASSRSLFKHIAQGSGLYSIVQVLPPLVSLILVPITTRVLTRADYGVQDLLSQVIVVISMLLGAYLGTSLGYFYYEAEPARRKQVVGTSILGSLSLGLLAGVICFPFAGRISDLVFPQLSAAPYLRLLFVLLPASFLIDALLSWLRVANRPGVFVLGSILRAGLTVAATIFFLGFLKLHVWGVLYSTTVALLVTTAVLVIYWLLSEGPAFDRALFVRMLRFSFPLAMGGLAMFILHFGDSFVLPHFRPYGDLGLYRLAYKVAMLVSAAYGAFGMYWYAQVFQIMRRQDAHVVFARLITYVLLGVSYFSLCLIVCARPALRKIAGPAFQDCASLIPLLVIAYFLRSIGDFMRGLFLFEGRPGYDAILTWTGAAVCIGGYALLIPPYGVWGAEYATLAAFAILAIISIIWTYRLHPYRVEAARLVKIGIASAAASACWAMLRGPSFPRLLVAAAAALIAFPLLLWILRFPTPGEIETGREVIRRGRRFIALRA